MTPEEMQVIKDSLLDSSKVGTLNALTFIQKGLEALKALQIPMVTYDMNNEPYEFHGYRKPNFQESIDFLITYIQTSLDTIGEVGQPKKEEK